MIEIIKAGIELITAGIKGRQKIKEAQIDAKVHNANIEAQERLQRASDMSTSWKDEFLLFIFCIPLVLAFIPSMVPYVLEGFEVLEQMPDWYQWAIIGMVSATFGLKGYRHMTFAKNRSQRVTGSRKD